MNRMQAIEVIARLLKDSDAGFSMDVTIMVNCETSDGTPYRRQAEPPTTTMARLLVEEIERNGGIIT